jgi:hypothetical protein
MIAAFILVFSTVALVRFGICQWRAMWLTVAARPLSDYLQAATGVDAKRLRAEDFHLIAKTSHYVSPAPQERKVWLREVGIYYRLVSAMERLAGRHIPALATWAQSELLSCAKYAAAVLDQRLNANLAYVAGLSRS